MRSNRCKGSVVALLVAVLALVHARDASAKQDWLGWLEEFSGPGPFHGWELSAEILCYNFVSETAFTRTSVKRAQVAAALELLEQTEDVLRPHKGTTTIDQLLREIADFRGRLKEHRDWLEPFRVESIGRSLKGQSGKGLTPDDERSQWTKLRMDVSSFYVRLHASQPSLFAVAPDPQVKSNNRVTPFSANEQLPRLFDATTPDVFSPSSPHYLGLGDPVYLQQTARDVRSLGRSKRRPWAPCLRGQNQLERDRAAKQVEATRNAPRFFSGEQFDQPIVTSHTDHVIGIVVNYGRYNSLSNPYVSATDGSLQEGPPLRLQLFELLAHSKLSPAVDVGAGIGYAVFTASGGTESHANLYWVPLSVVIRPGTFISDGRWASVWGYRASARYFRNLNGYDFGNPNSRFDASAGDFGWGISMFFDATAIVGRGR